MPKADGSIIIDTKIRDENLNSEFEKLTKTFKEISKTLNSLAREIRKFTQEMAETTPKAEEMSKDVGEATKNVDALGKEVGETAKNVDTLGKEAEKSANNTEKLAKGLEDVEKEAEEAAPDLDKVADETEKIGENSKDAENGLSGLFGKIFGASAVADIAADVLKQAAEAIKDFVMDSVSAAAEVKASNAQFEQTFKDLEGTAEKSLNNISRQTQISATRMKNSYSSVYAFTKSVGADSATAMDIANRAMIAAADSAAYYDRTIEDATETLQSFLKGNYENDAALGIAATETTRNAKANEKYAKSFDKLSESQKVDVLLAMVEAGNEASGALGQAAREADSWANVTGEASEAVKQLLAELGSPILEAIIPKIQKITAAINEMLEETASDKFRKNMQEITDRWEDAEKQFRTTSDEIQTTAEKASYYIDRLDELEAAGVKTAESQREYADIVSFLNELYPSLNLVIDENTGLLITNTNAIRNSVEAMKQKALYEAYERRYADALSAQADAVVEVRKAQRELTRASEEHEEITRKLTSSTGKEVEALKTIYRAQRNVELAEKYSAEEAAAAMQAFEYLTGSMEMLSDADMELVERLIELEKEEKNLTKDIKDGEAIIAEYDAQLEQVKEELGLVAEETEKCGDNQEVIITATEKATNAIKGMAQAHNEAKVAARESIDSQIGLFEELSVRSERSSSQIIENWKKQKEAFLNYADNLQKAIDMGLDEELVRQLSDGSAASMAILDEFVNGTSANIDQINDAFENLNQAKDTAADAIAGVQTDVDGELKEIIKDAHMAGADIPEVLAKGISEHSEYVADAMRELAQDALKVYYDSLKGMNFPIPQKSSGKYDVVPYADTASVAPSAFSVPYLATGAVIPPNAPFMAVLGDQRRGTNVEAPLSTIQEAVALVMQDQAAAMLAGFEALLQENRMLRKTVEGIEVGDTTIGQAADRYARKMAVVKGGG